MTAEHFDNALRGLREIKPFQAFAVELHDGKRFKLDHPGALVVRDGVAVYLAPGGIPVWFDHDRVTQIFGADKNSLSELPGSGA